MSTKYCPFKASANRTCDRELCALWMYGHCSHCCVAETLEEIKELLDQRRDVITEKEV